MVSCNFFNNSVVLRILGNLFHSDFLVETGLRAIVTQCLCRFSIRDMYKCPRIAWATQKPSSVPFLSLHVDSTVLLWGSVLFWAGYFIVQNLSADPKPFLPQEVKRLQRQVSLCLMGNSVPHFPKIIVIGCCGNRGVGREIE